MTRFYVTRKEGGAYVGLFTLGEIRARLGTGELKEGFFVTESDGRSYNQFRKSGNGTWRTLAALLTEYPVEVDPPAPKHPWVSRRLADHFQGGELAGCLLHVGMLAAALSCLAAPLALAAFPSGTGLLVGIWSFCVSAAMVVVYMRALGVERIAVDQDAENHRLWRTIEELQSRDESSPSSDDQMPDKPLPPSEPA